MADAIRHADICRLAGRAISEARAMACAVTGFIFILPVMLRRQRASVSA